MEFEELYQKITNENSRKLLEVKDFEITFNSLKSLCYEQSPSKLESINCYLALLDEPFRKQLFLKLGSRYKSELFVMKHTNVERFYRNNSDDKRFQLDDSSNNQKEKTEAEGDSSFYMSDWKLYHQVLFNMMESLYTGVEHDYQIADVEVENNQSEIIELLMDMHQQIK